VRVPVVGEDTVFVIPLFESGFSLGLVRGRASPLGEAGGSEDEEYGSVYERSK